MPEKPLTKISTHLCLKTLKKKDHRRILPQIVKAIYVKPTVQFSSAQSFSRVQLFATP